jgi:SAM-dependent methyltransferase
MMPTYDQAFYAGQMDGSFTSAMEIVPIVMGLLPIRSVCDVGCGVGTWLAAFNSLGIPDVVGLDGDYVDTALLQIPPAQFRPMDLGKPIKLERSFDLAISLEVAEHLDPSRADGFVQDITALAPAILFSAAIPRQGGTHHVNEQWQSWWAEKFERQGYVACDVIRSRVWSNAKVDFWYKQNIVLYVCKDLANTHPRLRDGSRGPLDIVHPISYESAGTTDGKRLLMKRIWWSLSRDWNQLRF